MNFKLINLDDKKDFKFNLAEITEQDWKFFLEDVVLNTSKKQKDVRSIMASVSIRDNKAKVKLAYEDGNYHELVMTIDAFGSSAHGYSDKISKIWQDLMAARFGKAYHAELKAVSAEASC